MAQAQELYPGLLPIQVAKFYDFPMKYTGKGQSIAIISLGGQLDTDELKSDFRDLRISPAPDIKVVDLPGISQQQNAQPTGESHLDVEVIGSICPEASITIYRGPNPGGFADAIQAAVDADNSVISISWGGPEQPGEDQSKMEAVLQKARERGITVCAAAGDGGSSDERGQDGNPAPAPGNVAQVDYPASSPNVLACGGTELIKEKNGQLTQWVWNNTPRGGAGGGGVSSVFPLPNYQEKAGINIPSVNTGQSGRVVPDLAGLAAGGDWEIYDSGRGEKVGGTSAVAPLWASFIALVNEARAQSGKPRLGFINDRLYELASRGDLFAEITEGNNKISPDYPGYDATPGFDACTGWGTPIGSSLAEALTQLD